MITLKEACNIIQKNRPNFRILGCDDYGNVYGFNLVPRRWNGDPDNLPAGSAIDTVDKQSGKVGCFYEYDKHPNNIKTLNVIPFLSKEDALFAQKANEALNSYNEQEVETFGL